MKFYVKIILLFAFFTILLKNAVFSQNIVIYNEITEFPLPGVAVYNEDRSVSLMSDADGTLNIDKFSETDSIIFRQTFFHQLIFTKEEIMHMGNKVYLVPSDLLVKLINVVGSTARENARELPYKLDKIYSEDIINSTAQNSADLLLQTGNVAIQKSQGGGGSPIIRGFEANKILLVVDGVRMNNAIYRSGHLQNSITIDNSVLEKVNVIYGPSSVIYGSDALGGVIHYFTKSPELAVNNANPIMKVSSYDQFSSASKSYVRHTDFNVGYKKLGFLTSVTYSNFGNITIGRNRHFSGNDSDWGKNLYYLKNINGDSTFQNPNPRIQMQTGYKQYDFLQKIRYSPHKNTDLTLNVQYSTSSNINRYDKLTSFKKGNLKYAEWFYGPQKRLMTTFEIFHKSINNRLFTNMKSIFAVQRIEESRNSRKFGNTKLLNQTEKLNIFSYNLDFLKIIDLNRLNYGFEIYYNDVQSVAHYEDIFSYEKTIAQTRYPDDGSYMNTTAIYANYKYMLDEMNIITAGLRYSHILLNSKFMNYPELVQLPFNEINIQTSAPTGSLSYNWFPLPKLQLVGTVSTGFRSPNIDDYGKIRAKNDLVTVPFDKLKPEYAYNAEIGVTRTIHENFRINATVFYTFVNNAIVRDYYQLNGKDSLFYDGDNYRIITNVNAGEATITGISLIAESDWQLDSIFSFTKGNLQFRGTFNYIEGKNIADTVPLGHIPPIYGLASLKYQYKKISTTFSMNYNGYKSIDDMSPYGEDNEEQGLEDGFPAWYIFNASVSYKVSRKIGLNFAIDNIFDEHYRPFASGISAPGRNFVFTFKLNL